MKSLSFIGLVLLAVAALLFYLTTDFALEKFTLSHVMGIMGGIGIGLILGGMIGYISKGSAMKEAQQKKDYKQLQKEKEALEKQAAELAKQQETLVQEKNNPQNL